MTTSGELAITLGEANPLTYRGYVYDTETGFYYLQSRYYDPSIGRFLNTDAYTSTGQGIIGNNMFAYCNNSPIGYADSAGSIPTCVVVSKSTTEVRRDEDGSVTYETTITYDLYISVTPENMIVHQNQSVTHMYTVNSQGKIAYDNSQAAAISLLFHGIRYTLADEMMKTTIEQVPDALKGRTIDGVAFELESHVICSSLEIRPDLTNVTHIGASVYGSIGYDYNGDWFEHPFKHLDEIFALIME